MALTRQNIWMHSSAILTGNRLRKGLQDTWKQEKMKALKREELQGMLKKHEPFVLINVLGAERFEKEHIPGSINVPLGNIEEYAKKKLLDKGEKIVVYCAGFQCRASPNASKKLEEIGYTNVYDFEGGMEDWKDAGYPVEKGCTVSCEPRGLGKTAKK